MPTKSRLIPGITLAGRTRGGGSEMITWARNGPLRLDRTRTDIVSGTYLSSQVYQQYQGQPCLVADSVGLLNGTALSDSEVRVHGTTAVANSNPTSPSVNLLTSFGEITNDGIPNPADFLRWEKTTRGILAQSGKNYVGVHFAWLPLLAEIRSYCENVRNADRIIAEARKRDSQKVIRVGYTFPTTRTIVSDLRTTVVIHWAGGFSTGDSSPARFFQKNESKVWFEAKWVHLLPISRAQADASLSFAQKAKHILGLHLTPETLWELAPWSWAIDWFTNFGDVLSSITNFLSDGLVMTEGFVMHHFSREAEIVDLKPHHFLGGPIVVAPSMRTRTMSETKKRFPSVPYFGFGSVGELTPRQISILAALGISKL